MLWWQDLFLASSAVQRLTVQQRCQDVRSWAPLQPILSAIPKQFKHRRQTQGLALASQEIDEEIKAKATDDWKVPGRQVHPRMRRTEGFKIRCKFVYHSQLTPKTTQTGEPEPPNRRHAEMQRGGLWSPRDTVRSPSRRWECCQLEIQQVQVLPTQPGAEDTPPPSPGGGHG